MNSMTGFGRAALSVGARRVVVEVRSVNHRGLDVKVRSRVLGGAAEVEAIRAVRASCLRGSVQLSIDEEGASGPASGENDLEPARLQALAAELESVRAALGLAGGVDLATLAAFVRLRRERGAVSPTPLTWAEVAPAVGEALLGLGRARAVEGTALAAELRTRAATLARLVSDIRARLPASAERARLRLTERLAAAAAAFGQAEGLDPARLAQETAILADRLDVTEELARLGVHLERLGELLAQGGAPGEGLGRPLEFLLQEVGRELNTLGTKAQDADISALVIAGKAELEKIREQAQNIE